MSANINQILLLKDAECITGIKRDSNLLKLNFSSAVFSF
jgi:hypothetical protein